MRCFVERRRRYEPFLSLVAMLLRSRYEKRSAGLATCAFFLLARERIAVLADYQQNHEQSSDQNNVRRSMHVVKHAVDFVHL